MPRYLQANDVFHCERVRGAAAPAAIRRWVTWPSVGSPAAERTIRARRVAVDAEILTSGARSGLWRWAAR